MISVSLRRLSFCLLGKVIYDEAVAAGVPKDWVGTLPGFSIL